MYFDQQTGLNARVNSGSTLRVGISAQSYPFPAPTDIADFQLRLPGDKPLVSALFQVGAYKAAFGEVDAQIPVVTDKLSVGAGFGLSHDSFDWGAGALYGDAGLIARWRPSDAVEVIPFWSRSELGDWETKPFVFTAGNYLPPNIKRRHFFGQEWTQWR